MFVQVGEISCDGVNLWNPGALEAFSRIQERRSSMGYELDGLSFNNDFVVERPYDHSEHISYILHFTQNMGERVPIDNTLVALGLVSRSPKSLQPARLLQPPKLCCLTIVCGRQRSERME